MIKTNEQRKRILDSREDGKQKTLNYKDKKRIKRNSKDSVRLQCNFIMKHKGGRRCNMTRRAEEKYCAQHILEIKDSIGGRKRIRCPLDSGHTIWEDQLENHKLRCQKNPELKMPKSRWFKEDFNIVGKKRHEETNGQNLSGFDSKHPSPSDYQKWIEIIHRTYINIGESVQQSIMDHYGLKNRLDELENKKHALQQASLIGNLDYHGVLTSGDITIIEFGCGRGELSRYLAKAQLLKHSKEHKDEEIAQRKYLLIDKAGPRMKLDSKIEKDYTESPSALTQLAPKVQRLKTDIKDLILDEVPFLKEDNAMVVAVSKHLCGSATDLTLQCLKNSKLIADKRLSGIEIALCCRQLCTYEMYPEVGKQWLLDNGINSDGFKILTTMTSWAVCGSRSNRQNEPNNHPSNLEEKERKKVGQMARRIIDHGRLLFLRSWGFNAKLVEYINQDTSLENICIIAGPRESMTV